MKRRREEKINCARLGGFAVIDENVNFNSNQTREERERINNREACDIMFK